MLLTPTNQSVMDALSTSGYALLTPQQLTIQLGEPAAQLDPMRESWSRLPKDNYLRDGGNYRHRRHSCFVHDIAAGELSMTPHRAHWQPTDYNALHGGMERWFEPIEPAVVANPEWVRLLKKLGNLFAAIRAVPQWFIEAHQFRIDTAEGIGRPTPEGAHRDGVDYVVVMLINRSHIRGGETRVFDAHGPTGVRFTMTEPWTTLLLDDARVIHETTPIQQEAPTSASSRNDGVRDTLVLTYRAGGFQAPARERGGS